MIIGGKRGGNLRRMRSAQQEQLRQQGGVVKAVHIGAVKGALGIGAFDHIHHKCPVAREGGQLFHALFAGVQLRYSRDTGGRAVIAQHLFHLLPVLGKQAQQGKQRAFVAVCAKNDLNVAGIALGQGFPRVQGEQVVLDRAGHEDAGMAARAFLECERSGRKHVLRGHIQQFGHVCTRIDTQLFKKDGVVHLDHAAGFGISCDAALGDGLLEQPLCDGRCQHVVHARAACGFARNGHVVRVAAKCGYIVTHPAQGGNLV